jgi:hypothetical protein
MSRWFPVHLSRERFKVACLAAPQQRLSMRPVRCRHVVGAGLLFRVKLEALQEVGAAFRVEAAPHPSQKIYDLSPGEVGPQRHVAGDVRQASVQRDRLAPRVAAEQPDLAGVLADQAEQDAQRGGLAGAVGGPGSRAPRRPSRTGRARPGRGSGRRICAVRTRLSHQSRWSISSTVNRSPVAVLPPLRLSTPPSVFALRPVARGR